MRSILFILTFLSLQFSSVAQVSYIDWVKKDILGSFGLLAGDNREYRVDIKESVGLLKVQLSGREKIACEFIMDSMDVCVSSTYTYYCDDCCEKHIKEFVDNKYYGWIKRSPGLYYSKRKEKTQMEIFNSNPAVTVITFTKIDWTRKEYKALIKKQ